jgi:hypothetical protein
MPAGSLVDCGYEFVDGAAMRAALEQTGSLSDWNVFAASWTDLAIDPYLAETARYRTRRYAVFTAASNGAIAREPHQPHFQHHDYNRLFGGVERWFEPITDAVGGSNTLRTILSFAVRVFGERAPAVRRWHVEVHQFRIEACVELPGQPTPEGAHRDGVDFVVVLLVNRDNIVSGVTTVYDLTGTPLGAFTLTHPFDATLIDDSRVAHGVTAVTPLDPARPGRRDVLVVTLRGQEA